MYALKSGRHEIELNEGETILGRGSACNLILEGALVSRRHAQLVVQGAAITIADLNSRNGIAVNGRRVRETTALKPGDVILVGDTEIELIERRSSTDEERATRTNLRAQRTLPGAHPRPASADERASAERRPISEQPPPHAAGEDVAAEDEETRTAHAFDLLTGVFDKALIMGKVEEASRLLSVHFERIEDALMAGQSVPTSLSDAAAGYAVKLADATGKGAWIDVALRIFIAQKRALPVEVIDELYTVVRRAHGANRHLLRKYVEVLGTVELTAAERFALKRLEGLTRVF